MDDAIRFGVDVIEHDTILGLLTLAFVLWAAVVYKIGKAIVDKLDIIRLSFEVLDKKILVIEKYISFVHKEPEFIPYDMLDKHNSHKLI